MWTPLDQGGYRIENVYYPDVPAWSLSSDPHPADCAAPGTHDCAACAQFDPQHKALADALDHRFKSLEKRVNDTLLTVLQGQQRIIGNQEKIVQGVHRHIGDVVALLAPTHEQELPHGTSSATSETLAKPAAHEETVRLDRFASRVRRQIRQAAAVRQERSARPPPQRPLRQQLVAGFAWVASFGLLSSAVIPDDWAESVLGEGIAVVMDDNADEKPAPMRPNRPSRKLAARLPALEDDERARKPDKKWRKPEKKLVA